MSDGGGRRAANEKRIHGMGVETAIRALASLLDPTRRGYNYSTHPSGIKHPLCIFVLKMEVFVFSFQKHKVLRFNVRNALKKS